MFIRELLSNCSDALEKQRFKLTTGEMDQGSQPLEISISTSSKERTITIFDGGIGMTRDEIIDNLGTIAKSGSQDFRNAMEEADNQMDGGAGESIIGQFGVGFYSSFVVSDHVEVFSRAAGAERTVVANKAGLM